MWLNLPSPKPIGLCPGRRALGVLLMMFLVTHALIAAPDSFSSFNVRLWQTEEGLPHDTVQAIAQTSDGYLWIGTQEGLARFDGSRFTEFDLAPGATRLSVTALLNGRDGELWIGTEQSGLYCLRNGSLTHYGDGGALANAAVSQIKESLDGVVWIAYRDGLARWKKGVFQFPVDVALTTNVVLSLCLDNDGGVWIGAAREVQRWTEHGIETNRVANGHALRATRGLWADPDGGIWIGGNSWLVLKQNGTLTSFSKGNGPSGIITTLLRDHSGHFWVGTKGGLSLFDNGVFHENQESGGAAYAIYALFEDREGSVWVGSEEGLMRLTAKPFVTYTRQSGLTQNATTSICPGKDGSIWIGTWGGGLDHLKDGVITAYDRKSGLSSDFVVAIEETRDGSLWAATAYGPGLNRLKDGQLAWDRTASAQIGSVVTIFFEDHENKLWVGSHNGLFWFSQSGDLVNDGLIAFTNRVINSLCESRNGNLWIGTDAGLARWNGQQFESPELPGHGSKTSVLSLYEDKQGNLWMGMMGEGLGRLADGIFKTFSTRQGLPSDSIYAILEDSHQNLWLNSSKGIFRVAKNQFDELVRGSISSLNCIVYGKADGVLGNGQSLDITQPAACRGEDGRFWFRTTQGVVAIDPDKITSNELPPPVAIEEIIFDRRTVFNPASLRGPTSTSSPQTLHPAPLTLDLPPGHGELEIHYTALSLRAPEKNQFKYKLFGADRDWVDAGGRRTAYYNHLSPGTYSFHVIACNNDGVWNDQGAIISLILRPHLWETWWFITLGIILAVILIGGITRFVTRRRLQRRLERLEQQHGIEKERARIARDMHDELGAKLTRISFQGATALRSLEDRTEAERQVGSMAQTARDLVASLDEIVWAVDPGNDSLENLANYICRYASDLCENGPMTCDLIIPAKLPDCRLATDVRHNVFLAFKEALNNALKHSAGTQVQISLLARADEFEVQIADNGCGFVVPRPGDNTPDRTKRTGHGLANLRERLSALNGRCEVESKPGEGTRVRLIVPLAPA